MVGISAKRSSVREVHGRCAAGGGDKCRKVKCVEVCGRCTGGGGDKCRKVECARGAQEMVGISAERSNVQEVHRRWWR